MRHQGKTDAINSADDATPFALEHCTQWPHLTTARESKLVFASLIIGRIQHGPDQSFNGDSTGIRRRITLGIIETFSSLKRQANSLDN